MFSSDKYTYVLSVRTSDNCLYQGTLSLCDTTNLKSIGPCYYLANAGSYCCSMEDKKRLFMVDGTRNNEGGSTEVTIVLHNEHTSFLTKSNGRWCDIHHLVGTEGFNPHRWFMK